MRQRLQFENHVALQAGHRKLVQAAGVVFALAVALGFGLLVMALMARDALNTEMAARATLNAHAADEA